MPTLPKALVSSVRFAISCLFSLGVLSAASHVAAQTAPAAPAPPASSPAATASQPGLSESILRQAQGPYRMIMNSPTVVRPKPAVAPVPAAARVPEPVTATAPPLRRSGNAAPDVQAPLAPQPPQTSVTARAAPAPETVAAPVNVPPAGPALSPVTPAQAATPAVNPVAVPVAVPAPVPQRAPQPAVAVVVERPLVAVRQEEPLLSGPLARERPTGVVQVGFNVNADGSTGDVSVVSSTNRKLNSAVLNAVTKWVYQPLEAVRRVEVAIEFKND